MASPPSLPRPPIDPIDAVLLELDQIVAGCLASGSRAGYFAALYRRVTRTVRQRIGTGYFDDDARMELLDVTFAGLYLTAFLDLGAGADGAPIEFVPYPKPPYWPPYYPPDPYPSSPPPPPVPTPTTTVVPSP